MLYTFAIYLYQLAVILVSPFHRKARAMMHGQRQSFRILREKVDPTARYVWFHAASLGEFEQGRPLMDRFRQQHPEFKILLTFFSPSGYEVRKNYEGADIICYLPFDTPINTVHFFRLVRPEMAFFIKYEFWMNYILSCRYFHIPFISVSSIFRRNKIFFRWYGWNYAQVLKFVKYFFVQDEESARLLATRGIRNNVTVVGDTRFDRVLDICHQARPLPLVEKFVGQAKNVVLVAGSTWAPDEDLIIPYFNTHADMKLVLAPHVINEEHLQQIEGKLWRPSVRYTQATADNIADADCVILDCFGLLSSIYRYGDFAYVGGGFGAGIHNVPEAAVYGIPVLFGPKNKGFREAQDMLRLGGCFEITGQSLFNAAADHLREDEDLRTRRGAINKSYIESNAGAADTIFRSLGL